MGDGSDKWVSHDGFWYERTANGWLKGPPALGPRQHDARIAPPRADALIDEALARQKPEQENNGYVREKHDPDQVWKALQECWNG